MDSRRLRNFRNNFDRRSLDKQVDKIFETGRQFVDGVSGSRPGKKRNTDFQGISRSNVKNVGRWVSDKMDMFFEEEEDNWDDQQNNYQEAQDIKSFSRKSISVDAEKPFSKRPLEALSLRQPKSLQMDQQKKLPYRKSNSFDEWPDDSDLKVDRWQRSSEKINEININQDNPKSGSNNGRSIPRSRRRRI
ncbi:RNA helicase [Prochlorococcus sp. AH-716-K03]|nr:RNA helicase [Prochlorococcus sp. AH-716-K03]